MNKFENYAILSMVLLLQSSFFGQTTKESEVEFFRDFGKPGILRVIRKPAEQPSTRELDQALEEMRKRFARPGSEASSTTQSATTGPIRAFPLATYSFIFSPQGEPTERELFSVQTWQIPGSISGKFYHTFAAEIVDDSLLVIVYEREPVTFFHVIELDPQKLDRGLPKQPEIVMRTDSAFGVPHVLSAEIQGSLDRQTFVVALTADYDSRDHRTRERKVVRFGLKQTDKGWEWGSVGP